VFDPPDGQWEIVPFARSWEEDEFIEFPDRPTFVRFLRQFKPDRKVMLHLRGVLTPPYQVSRFSDDQVIELVAWKVAVHHLALRRRFRWYQPDVKSSGDGSGGGGGGGGGRSQAAGSSPAPASQAINDSPTKSTKSWFSVTVVHEVNGSEKVVDGLTIQCQLPDLGKTSGMTSRNTPHVRFNDLNPGGTGDVLATSHDEIVWEVVSDID
jgi:hypothetical protein